MRDNNLAPLAKGWHWRKFGDCARLVNGRAYSQSELLDSGTPVLRIQNLNGGDRWYYSNLTLPDEKYCEAGELLYAWSASFGPYRFAGPKSIFHYHIWRVLPGEDLDKDFAFRLLEWVTTKIKSAAHGVAMLHMTKAGMEAWPIPVPPMAEQRRIAELLDRTDTLRAKRGDALAQLDTLTQAIFLDLFGDPATNPKGWPVRTIDAVVHSITNGLTRRRKETERGESIVLRLRDIRSGWIDFGDVNRITLTSDEASRYQALAGDVLFIRVNGNPEYVGRCALFDGHPEPVYFNDHIMRVRLNRSVASGIFLAFVLNGPHGKREITSHRKTSAGQHTINQDGLSRIRIPLPPLSLQAEFARRIAAVGRLKSTHRASLVELDALFATLQHRAFRGEL